MREELSEILSEISDNIERNVLLGGCFSFLPKDGTFLERIIGNEDNIV